MISPPTCLPARPSELLVFIKILFPRAVLDCMWILDEAVCRTQGKEGHGLGWSAIPGLIENGSPRKKPRAGQGMTPEPQQAGFGWV